MKIKNLLLLAVLIAGLSSCSEKKHEDQDDEMTSEEADEMEWPAMDAFHMVMAEAFHPFKDSTNLAPVKQLAEEMALEAEKWAASTLPEKVNTDEVKAQLKQLRADSRTLADKIKGGATDQEIGTSLQALHESFHGIMETWNADGEEHEHQ
jgi:uncharacterized lipoprotein